MDKKKDKAQITSGMEEAVTWDLQNIKIVKLYFRRHLVLPDRVVSFLQDSSLLLKTLDITKKQKRTLEISKKQEVP